ncbi:ice-binding family protein [Flavobacterium sp. RHBU_24]|uniref:ice-binding family protein n=1 Tax=Flavobacterium sp. RHBU_24 TaxID=3391185 RepID=UPI00398480B7
MKRTLLFILTGIAVVALPNTGFSQAPALGTTAEFALFSSNGAISNTGLSHLTGNVGTNNGSSTAFGNVNGVMNDSNGASVAAATDLLIAYNQLDAATPTLFPAPLLGNGQSLNAGIYSVAGSATLDGTLTLNAQGNANAVFIIQIEGAFSSSAASQVVLSNNAQACNVFWKVEGLVSLATGTSIKGTIIANNAAIVLGSGVELEGRALSTTGAITVNEVLVYTPVGCGSPLLTGPAAPALGTVACYTLFSATGQVSNTGVSYVTGDIGTNGGLTTGYDDLNVTGTIHSTADTSTAEAAADLGELYTALNTLPFDIQLLYPAQLGNDLVLTPHTYLLNAETVLTNNLILDAQDNANGIFVIQINGALTTSTYAKILLVNGAQAKNVFWKVTGAVNINDYSEFKGTLVNAGALILNTGTILSGRALTINGSLTTMSVNAVMTPGCGTVEPPCTAPVAPSVTAQNFCQSGTVAQLIATGTTGATFNWYATPTSATALSGTTALASGTYYVTQTVDTCESIRVGVTVTINAVPSIPTADTTQSFCAGATVADLSATASGGATVNWSLTSNGATLSNSAVLVAVNYYATQTLGTCESNSLTVAVTINAVPSIPTADTTQSFCAGATVADLSATASGGATVNWSLTSNGATLSNSAVLVAGNYYATQTLGTCESNAITVAVTINATPAIPTADTTQSFCAGATVADLSATASGGATVNWSLTSNGSTLSNSAVLVAGNYYATQTLGTCESNALTVAVTINATPAIPTADTTQSFCAGATVADLSATASGGATINWSLTSNGTTLSNSAVLVAGNYYATQTLGTCESNSLTVAVTINAVPAMPIGDATQDFTEGETVADLTLSNTTGISWYVMVDDELVSVPVTTVLVDGETYYATQTMNGCESDYFEVTATQVLATDTFSLNNVRVYPNPVAAVLTVTSAEGIAGVAVFNLMGQKVLDQNTTGTEVKVNVEMLAAGTYLLQITTLTGRHTATRVIKQ